MCTERLARRVRRVPLLIAIACAVACVPLESRGAQINWRSETFNYVAQNKPLKEFIREFAAAQGLTVVVAPEVQGTVNGKFNLTPASLLELLSTSFGISWYYDGSVLHIYPATDVATEVIRLEVIGVGQLRETLNRLDIADPRFPIAYDARNRTARVSGPKRYVELVKQTAKAIDRSRSGQATADIRVFPLRYAWAADFVYVQGGVEQRLPGIASVLRELYAPSQVLGTRYTAPSQATTEQRRLDQARSMGLLPPERDEPQGSGPPVQQLLSSTELPQFQADGRMNAVLVRDIPERMPFYEQVIRSLDVKPGLVEIEARVLEVRTDAIDSLGIDWRAHSGSADLKIDLRRRGGRSYNPVFNGPLPPPGARTDLPRGGVLTTVLRDSGRFLMARVNALAQQGKANVLSSPRVLTLDNVEAVLENLNTFFVRVSGNLDVSLFDVSSGTSLRVTPLIVTEGELKQVKLAIRIEDGSISGESVDRIPVVQRSTINTQAFVNEGESLLIGGYESTVDQQTRTGVPGLSSVPLLGKLFQYNEKQKTTVQRLFLLTPRIVQQ
jgi:type III secretion protein C